MSVESLQQFYLLVLDTPELQDQLRDIDDTEMFLAALVRIAAERGCHFTRDEANAALMAARASWLQRWAYW